ncbi:Bgt-50204 [Blumeria graminis f. sp. tritici]|uniref:Bgt-50204 n=1 Tax=Blumeria graminis f. sp. tritici TaxID=62690 RepID=A0A9X9MER5_BLUGR|nr:Bgt-50204 [Blumeria graminis f. sp. tritici]
MFSRVSQTSGMYFLKEKLGPSRLHAFGSVTRYMKRLNNTKERYQTRKL